MNTLKTTLIAFVLIISACKTTNQTQTAESLFLDVIWELESSPVLDPSILETKPYFNFTIKDNVKNISGYTSCNRFFGPVEWKGNTMKIGELAATEMFCEGKMDNEKAFLELLAGVESYRVESEKLVLLKGKSILATFRKLTKNR